MVTSINSLTKHNLRCIEIDSPLVEAFVLMQKSKIRHLPVKDGEQVVGILSDRDIQRGLRTEIFETEGRQLIDTKIPLDFTVRQFMSWPVKTVKAGQSVREVTRRMIREKVSAFLVTDGLDVVGIVTHEDLLLHLDSILSAADGHSSWAEKIEALPVERLLQGLSNSGI